MITFYSAQRQIEQRRADDMSWARTARMAREAKHVTTRAQTKSPRPAGPVTLCGTEHRAKS